MQIEEYPVRRAEILAACDREFVSGQSVVYFLQAGNDGPVKIGYCSKLDGVARRVGGLQVGCPWPLIIRRIMAAPDGRITEAELHRHFAAYRIGGEWFAPVPEVAEMAAGTTRMTGDAIERAAAAGYANGVKAGAEQEAGAMARRIADDLRETAARYEAMEADETNPERTAAVLELRRAA